MQNTRITICACASRSFIDKKKVTEIAVDLKSKGYTVNVIPDLCRKVMQKDNDIEKISEETILACYPRAVQGHFDWLSLKTNTVVDIRNGNPQDILLQFPQLTESLESQNIELLEEEIQRFPVENGTDAWYPVLDKTKCIECGKCHDFCLFGVYTIENKKVKVVKPQNCKNNCPACARMCPSKAIIFPKYEKSPINGGTAEEEIFNPEEMDKMYRERLRMRLQQRRASVSLLRKDNK